jgi:hypothetical protein
MKKISIWLFFALVIVIGFTACKPSFEQQRALSVEYLTASNKILNDLDKTVNLGLDMRKIDHLNQEIPAYQGAIQSVKSLKVPNIDEAEEFQKALLKFFQDWLAIKEQQLAGLQSGGGNQRAEGQALSEVIEQLRSSLTIAESIMQKYNITDSEVGYTFRSPSGDK